LMLRLLGVVFSTRPGAKLKAIFGK